jgi:hypothetical protein
MSAPSRVIEPRVANACRQVGIFPAHMRRRHRLRHGRGGISFTRRRCSTRHPFGRRLLVVDDPAQPRLLGSVERSMFQPRSTQICFARSPWRRELPHHFAKPHMIAHFSSNEHRCQNFPYFLCARLTQSDRNTSATIRTPFHNRTAAYGRTCRRHSPARALDQASAVHTAPLPTASAHPARCPACRPSAR